MNECYNKWKSFLCLTCFVGLLLTGASVYAADSMVTMSVVDADVRDVLTGLSTIGRVNVVIDDAVTGRISVNFKNIPFETALEIITKSKGLSMHRTGNIIVFSSQEKMKKGFGQVKVFPLQYARADHVKNVIVGGGKSDSEFAVESPASSASSGSSGNSGSSGSAGSLKTTAGGATASSSNKEGIEGIVINTDASTNSLIVFGAPDQIDKVSLLLKELDVPYQQILLEAQVVSLSKQAIKNLGIDWSWSQFPPATSSSDSTTTTNYFPVGIITGGDSKQYSIGVNATVNALITKGDGQVLARPNVMTFNGNKASIFVGDQLPILTPSTNSGTTTNTTEYKNAGISLSYVPRINADNYITASVFVEVSTPMQVTLKTNSASTTAYQITTRSAQTNVRMKEGDTLVIGGLISSTDTKSLNKVPLLGDLPVLGQFFRSLSKSKNETEVVIFLKAKIVK